MAFGLLSAATWGAADFAAGLVTRRLGAFMTVALTQTVGLAGAVSLVVATGEPMPVSSALAWAIGAGAVGLLGASAFYRLLADGRMSLGSPIVAVIGAGLPVLVAFLLGERLPPSDVFGIVLGLLAVVLVSIPARSATSHDGHLDRRLLLLAGLAGTGIACFYLFVDRAAADGAGPWWILAAARGMTVGLVMIGLLAARPGWPDVRGSVAIIIAIGLGDLMGNAFFVLANAQGALSVAVVLSSLYPVTTILLARIILHERLRGGQLVGVAAALAGVVLIAI
ncbi:MAG TPA: DMT family transporter [Candidatus Limnocylindrales bacterium]